MRTLSQRRTMNYYNEWDSFAAAWLTELIKDGLIPYGEVDTRSITDVKPSELKGFTQCHFFAGIGGWSRALGMAGWSPDRPVWTGSPPCQSFSTAGKGKGKDDARHLWPTFFNLIRECQPPTVFGEQVAAAIRHGWLDDLQDDFEAEGYASGAVVLPSGSIGAFHKRDRLFFTAKRVADSFGSRSERVGWGRQERIAEHSETDFMVNSNDQGLQMYGEHGELYFRESDRENKDGQCSYTGILNTTGFWSESSAIYCRDGKYRQIPTEPAFFPMVNGIPNRVGILRGAGNAIVPQAAAEIIKAYLSHKQH
jgi:DNA (cytosine-5)-methyltransferase 1